jgi:hypothetical protein
LKRVLEQLPIIIWLQPPVWPEWIPQTPSEHGRLRSGFYLCGDEVSDTADAGGLLAPRVMLSAAHQAHTVLRILAGEYEA